MSAQWAKIEDVQNVDRTPLAADNFRREYIGLRGQLQTNAIEPERQGRMCFSFVDAKDDIKYEVCSSKGCVIEQGPTRLIYQSANARYIFHLL